MNETEPKKRTHRQSRAGRGHDKKKDAKQKLLPGLDNIAHKSSFVQNFNATYVCYL